MVKKTQTKIATLAIITQRRQTYASHVDFDSFSVFMCQFRCKKLWMEVFRLNSKEPVFGPLMHTVEVHTGWSCHIWSLYQYCKVKIDQCQLQWYLRRFLRVPAGFLGLTHCNYQIGVNRTKSEIPSTKSGPYCKVPGKDLVRKVRFGPD